MLYHEFLVSYQSRANLLAYTSVNTIANANQALMTQNTKVGIVTAAGYLEAEKYYGRLHGLLEAVAASEALTPKQKHNLVVMGTSPGLPAVILYRTHHY